MAKKKKNIEVEEIVNQPESMDQSEESEDTVSVETSLFLQEESESEGFLPEVTEEEVLSAKAVDETSTDDELSLHAAEEIDFEDAEQASLNLENSELEGFEAAQIDEVDFIEDVQAESIIESILFASDRPVSLASICEVFKGTNIKKSRVREILDTLAVEYAGGRRGISLEEITGGYQLRTKVDNMNFLKRSVKARPFKLSGPALEVLSIVAYKQPVVKHEIDQIRGVESGHLLRALMEKGLCNFEGKAETLPGKPMQYGTTRRFLEIFGLRNLKELPTLSQIDEILPEGIGEEEEQKPTLATVTDSMSEQVNSVSYSTGEEELGKIENELSEISTSSDFFEQEKIRQKEKRDAEKAQDIRDALAVGEEVPTRDRNWLMRYEEALSAPKVSMDEQNVNTPNDETAEMALDHSVEAEVIHQQNFVDEKADEDSLFADDSEDEDETSDELPFYAEADDDGEDSKEEPEQEGHA